MTYNHGSRIIEIYIDRRLDVRQNLSGKVPADARPHLPSYASIGGFDGPSYGEASPQRLDLGRLPLRGWPRRKMTSTSSAHHVLPDRVAVTPMAATAAQSTGSNCAPAWWAIIPIVGWIALQRAADCCAADTAIPSPTEVVQCIYSSFGSPPPAPIPAGRLVRRSDISLAEGVGVHIDVGGEGRVESNNIVTGFAEAINLQATDGGIGDGTRQTQPPYGPILNLVRMVSWSQPYPFANEFADYITMQNAPRTPHNVDEIARVVKPDGERAFWIDVEMWRTSIESLARRLAGRVIYNDTDEFHGRAGHPQDNDRPELPARRSVTRRPCSALDDERPAVGNKKGGGLSPYPFRELRGVGPYGVVTVTSSLCFQPVVPS